MGNILSNILESFNWGVLQKKILLLGLDGAGKTTILYKLNMGDTVNALPTVGFNVESVKYKNIEFTAWDVGGQKRIRQLWHHYYQGTNAVVFVIDSNDPIRLEEAQQELSHLMQQDAMRDVPLLVYANKQDLPHSMSTSEIANKLELSKICGRGGGGASWFVQGAVATSGSGLYEGLDWLSEAVRKTSQ